MLCARERGIYVSVMLFQGWSVRNFERGRQVFIYHPYHKDNNASGGSGDVNGNGEGEELNALDYPELTRLPVDFMPPFSGDAALYILHPE